MKKSLNARFLAQSLVVFLLSACISSQQAFAVVTPPVTKCNIRIDDPHISNYILRTRGILAVKVNARSKCDAPMRNLKFTVEIFKVGFFRDYKVAETKVLIRGVIYANQVIKNDKTYAECISQKPSKYYGIAYASAVIDGQPRKTLRVISAKTISLRCGS